MSKTIECPLCGWVMELDRNGDFYICPGCKCEVWPDSEGFDVWRDEQAYKRSISRPGSGSSGRKGPKKPRPKPIPWYQRAYW
mgnify:CR=1 FL=1